MTDVLIKRRALLTGGAGLLLAGCDRVAQIPAARKILFAGEDMHYGLQRALQDRGALAPEYRPDQMSPIFRANGTRNPDTPAYNAMATNRFADWRVRVGGMVDRPLSLSVADLASMPARSQITRHDCVEGWSAIGQVDERCRLHAQSTGSGAGRPTKWERPRSARASNPIHG